MSLPVAPNFDRIRLIPRPYDFLNRNVGASGELFYEFESQTLRLMNGRNRGGREIITEENLRKNAADVELATVKYNVTINNSGNGNKFVLNGEEAPEINFVVGYTYLFDQSDDSNVFYPNAAGGTINQHPLAFSSNNANGLLGGGTTYLTNVIYRLEGLVVSQAEYINEFSRSELRQVQITVTSTFPDTMYYYCTAHTNMGSSGTKGYPGSGSGSGASLSISDTAPDEPAVGTLWFDSTSGYLYVYVDDGDSQQWVQPVAGNVFSGNYDDLTNKPTLFDGAYSSLTGTPTIPSTLTDLGISDGTIGQVLTTDGAGSFTFTTVSGGGGGSFDQSLNTTDDVTFNSITSPTLLSNGTGVSSITSASTLTLEAVDAVIVTGSPFRLPSFTTTEKNALIASNGDMVYDSTLNKAQVYENGAWASIV